MTTPEPPVPERAQAAADAALNTSPLLAQINLAGWTRTIAMIAVEAAAPYIRASAEMAAGKAVMEREERIQAVERLARNLLARYREVIGSDQPDDIRAEIEAAEAILAGGEQK